MTATRDLSPTAAPALDYDVGRIRKDFPALDQEVHGRPLVYLDNAATSQKPRAVIEAIRAYYESDNANVHRGVHYLSERSTEAYEGARRRVQRFLNAADPAEIVFVRGTTEGINLVAATYGRTHLRPGDEVLVTGMEHHSNIVPWQLLCEATGAQLRVAPIDDDGDLVWAEYERLVGPRTRLVAVTHVSNALGTILPVKRLIARAHAEGAPVLVDGAQAAPHLRIDVQDLDCDFYVFSGHKAFGPMGIGALYGKAAWLERLPPYQGGGDMIASVSFERTVYAAPPHRFEAGTPHVAGAVGLAAALDYLEGIGLERITAYEHELTAYGTAVLESVPGVRLFGTARDKTSVLSFTLGDIHAHDVGTVLDHHGIAVRAGHHCAMPVMQRFGVPATVRASLALYNTREELDALGAALRAARQIFA